MPINKVPFLNVAGTIAETARNSEFWRWFINSLEPELRFSVFKKRWTKEKMLNYFLVYSFFLSNIKLRSCRYETIEEMKEAVTEVIDTLKQEDFYGAFQELMERYNNWWNGTTIDGTVQQLPEKNTSKGTIVSCVYFQ